jgi:glutamyl-tRNA reductase
MATRPGRPIVLIDIAVPRDLDSDIAGVRGVALHDIDDLERVVEATLNGRLLEAERAEGMVHEATARFAGWRRTTAVGPTISSLHERAEEIRRAELARADARWDSLSEDDRERVEALTRALVSKLLHEPTVRLKAAAEAGDGLGHLESLRHLFGLPEAPGR